jgi:ketosteroid isomerase-like protein
VPLLLEKVTADDVRHAVEAFWGAFLAKSEQTLQSFYETGSIVFQVSLGRSEPGKLGAMRRAREYFGANSRLEVKLSPIEVILLGKDCGVALYTFQFQCIGRDLGGKRVDERLEAVRATHVLKRDDTGQLRIVHEHFSIPVA